MKTDGNKNLSDLIKYKARELDFDICGIAKARILTERETIFREWLEAGMNHKMAYLKREQEKRFNPDLAFSGAKSIVVTGMSYYSDVKIREKNAPVMSRYAYGKDYHDVITSRLKKLMAFISSIAPLAAGRIFVDSGSIHEKSWAVEAGLGWQGRHSIVINREIGSFFLIGILIMNIELDYDEPFKGEYCRDCRLCIDECPADAINANRTIDTRKCISNLTIENRGPIPEEIIPKLGGRIYGCDRCQEVCPWNNKIPVNSHPEFTLPEEITEMNLEDWLSLTPERYKKLFGNSPLKRVKYETLMANIHAAARSLK
jgi:epoxyqueuosine reductase